MHCEVSELRRIVKNIERVVGWVSEAWNYEFTLGWRYGCFELSGTFYRSTEGAKSCSNEYCSRPSLKNSL